MMSEQFAPSPPVAPMQNKPHQNQNGSTYHQTMTTGITNVGAGLYQNNTKIGKDRKQF
jgi:hypothetical protein